MKNNLKALTLVPLFMVIAVSDVLGQSNDNTTAAQQTTEAAAKSDTTRYFTNAAGEKIEKSVSGQAGDRSAEADIVTVFVTKGPDNMEQFNGFKQAVIDKMATKGVPIEFFVKPVEQEGATFSYFIENHMHGPFNFEEFVVMLPEILRDYEREYPDDDNRIGAAKQEELNSKVPTLAKN